MSVAKALETNLSSWNIEEWGIMSLYQLVDKTWMAVVNLVRESAGLSMDMIRNFNKQGHLKCLIDYSELCKNSMKINLKKRYEYHARQNKNI